MKNLQEFLYVNFPKYNVCVQNIDVNVTIQNVSAGEATVLFCLSSEIGDLFIVNFALQSAIWLSNVSKICFNGLGMTPGTMRKFTIKATLSCLVIISVGRNS